MAFDLLVEIAARHVDRACGLRHVPVVRYYSPDEFTRLRDYGLELGFAHVEAGPLVRSSYHAHEQADAFDAAIKA